LILFGLYLGQRLGDLAKLTWRAVDLDSGEVAFTARKTGRRVVLPLLQPLTDYLTALPATDHPNAHIFPRAASAKRTGTLSNQFREIALGAGWGTHAPGSIAVRLRCPSWLSRPL
jgi:integrase